MVVNNARPMFNNCARQCNVVEEFKSSKYNGVYDYETVRPLGCPECLQNDDNDYKKTDVPDNSDDDIIFGHSIYISMLNTD